jgi:hypothetical protein
VAVGNESYKSNVVPTTVNPEWNFSCEFPIEYYHKAEVVVDVLDKSLHLPSIQEDAQIARVTEKIMRIKEEELIEGWYNSHIFQGRVNVRFDWIALTRERPPPAEAGACTTGVLCVAIGTLKSDSPVKLKCYLELVDGTSVTKWTSLDPLVGAKTECPINEGAVFRVLQCLSNSSLAIKIKDGKTKADIGERTFLIRRLLDKPLNGEFSFRNPFSNVNFTLTLKTEMLFDSVKPTQT